ncbi:hypothetical protein B8V81_2176 [Paenibacillus pasadenensis]|uniref:Uncharacterized protein n=1 Tax=Paenibacillus pasadenensis TaxID=217090 RepID=A0A2N5N086_9BACL|nr:hypothetical protein B8V81_2176 [Paenibacillus pasadenensis]
MRRRPKPRRRSARAPHPPRAQPHRRPATSRPRRRPPTHAPTRPTDTPPAE